MPNTLKPTESGHSAGSAPVRAQMIDRLPSVQRAVLLLRLVGGKTVDQTAAALNTTPDAVRLHQHRALNRLREELRNQPSA